MTDRQIFYGSDPLPPALLGGGEYRAPRPTGVPYSNTKVWPRDMRIWVNKHTGVAVAVGAQRHGKCEVYSQWSLLGASTCMEWYLEAYYTEVPPDGTHRLSPYDSDRRRNGRQGR